MKVLISEVAGEGRWSQFNLKLKWVEPFFGASPENLQVVPLCDLDASGNIATEYNQAAIYKSRSRNWAFEIPEANALGFSGVDRRPILAMSQRVDGFFSFELLMPNDAAYSGVSDFLNQNRETPGRHLARTIVDRSALGENMLGLNI